MYQLASHHPRVLCVTSTVPVPAHVGANIIISDLEGQQEACAIAVPILLADVALSQFAINVIHVVRHLDLVVFKVECNHVLVSE